MKRTLFLLAALPFVCCAQTNRIEIKALNYNDLSAVRRLDKFEIGVKLPNQVLTRVNNFVREADVAQSEKVNPFLDWELDVEAVMTHAETGLTKKIPAFYYREYERDQVGDSWTDVGTIHPMRIRFAPPLAGKWRCTVTMKVKGRPSEEQPSIDFVVVESANKGFFTVHPNKRNFQQDGRIVYPVGVNFPSPTKGVSNYHTSASGDVFSPKETFKVTKLSQWLQYHQDIKAYSESGGKYIRILQSGWSSLLEFEKKGNYYDRQPYAWEQDRLLEYCEQNGVYIHFNLMQQEPFMNYGNYDMFDWDWSHYRSDKTWFGGDIFPEYCYADGKNKQPHESMLDPEDMRYHEQRTRYYIARYGYSTSIYLFELLSEPWHVDQYGNYAEPAMADDELGATIRRAIRNYHETLAAYIKETLGHTNQLIGVDIFTAKFYEGETFTDQSIYHRDIDVVSFNPYTPIPDKLLIAKSSGNNVVQPDENSMARMVLTLNRQCGKPVMIAEGGAGDGVDDCSNFAQQYVDMMTFGFTGLAGYNSWVGWNTGHEILWPSMVGAQEFMNSPQVKNTLGSGKGEWIQGRQAERLARRDAKKIKELQYYLSQDQLTAVGYVKNRTFNFNTKSTNENCVRIALGKPFDQLKDVAWDEGKPLYVQGLRNATYTVTWYEYKTGAVIETQCMRSKRGKLKLHFPGLTVTEGKPERPVLWFSVTESECEL